MEKLKNRKRYGKKTKNLERKKSSKVKIKRIKIE